mgnify:FL=1
MGAVKLSVLGPNLNELRDEQGDEGWRNSMSRPRCGACARDAKRGLPIDKTVCRRLHSKATPWWERPALSEMTPAQICAELKRQSRRLARKQEG